MRQSNRRPVLKCGDVSLSVEARASSKAALGAKGRNKCGDKKDHVPSSPTRSKFAVAQHRVSCGDSRMDMWASHAHHRWAGEVDAIEHRPITGAWREYQANRPLAKANPSAWKVIKL